MPDRYSLSQETYREEMAYGRTRARRGRLRGVLRVLATVVLVPVLLAVAFVVSYILTCILNGAAPEDIPMLLGSLGERVQGWLANWAVLSG